MQTHKIQPTTIKSPQKVTMATRRAPPATPPAPPATAPPATSATPADLPPWATSKARELLKKDLLEGKVPLFPTTGVSTEQIYAMRPEFAEYAYEKFPSRLSSLRGAVRKRLKRADDDRASFERYVQNHTISHFNHAGLIQYQGSDAQEFLKNDIELGLHLRQSKQALWASRPEYYLNFPLHVFRDKLQQEIRTAKYLYTLKVRGKLHKAS